MEGSILSIFIRLHIQPERHLPWETIFLCFMVIIIITCFAKINIPAKSGKFFLGESVCHIRAVTAATGLFCKILGVGSFLSSYF